MNCSSSTQWYNRLTPDHLVCGVAEYWAELKTRKDKLEQGVSRLRSLTYRITFDAKKSDPSMMNDVARFQSSLLADISQVSV